MGSIALAALLVLLRPDCGDADGVTCESNLDCCRHLPWSSEFQACVKEKGGCTPDCKKVRYVSAIESYAMKFDCKTSYECCVYPFLSEAFLKCCIKHKCCPLCFQVSKGCCYNDKQYNWGDVVETFPGIKLVCGAKLYETEPFFVAAIVPVLQGFVKDHKCVKQSYCIEPNGIIHKNGSEWFINPCVLCHCEGGYIVCNQVRPKCPPRPYDECFAIRPAQGECCNRWDCSILKSMCVDAYGVVRREREQWTGRDDPCLLYMCKPGGMILSAYRRCPPSNARIPPGCELQERPNECCPALHCPECEDKNGITYAAGDTWKDPEDPCFTYYCLPGGSIQRTRKICPHLYRRSRDNCVLQQEDCCPKWICGGCIDRKGKVHAPGTTWTEPDEPCIIYECSDRGITLTSRIDCPPLGRKPEQSCYQILKNCCHEWKCPGDKTHCTDKQGVKREAGEEWIDPVNPCFHYRCTEDFEIVKTVRDCPRPQPRPNKSCWLAVDQCCPVWRCPCVDEAGVAKVVGDVWSHPTNECLSLECTSDGVQEIPVRCPKIPPRPGYNCVLELEDCCNVWRCPGDCPDPFSFDRRCFQYFDQCYSDRQCGSRMKCCLVAGCGKECMHVFPLTKPGQCPVIHYIVAPQCNPYITRDQCSLDQHCPGHQKCCQMECSKRCVNPL